MVPSKEPFADWRSSGWSFWTSMPPDVTVIFENRGWERGDGYARMGKWDMLQDIGQYWQIFIFIVETPTRIPTQYPDHWFGFKLRVSIHPSVPIPTTLGSLLFWSSGMRLWVRRYTPKWKGGEEEKDNYTYTTHWSLCIDSKSYPVCWWQSSSPNHHRSPLSCSPYTQHY